MNRETFAGLFPLGSHLCREPMPPMAELKHDMEGLKKHGVNLIKLQEHWMADEPAEGRYDFARYEELIAHAARLDLGVYVGLTCEQAPAWLWRKHPDCRMIGRNGLPIAYEAQTTLPADGKPGPCYDHPGARAEMVRFIRRLVETLGRHENVVVWNTWQEIGYWPEWLVGQHVCYCPHTLRHYRQWLRRQYPDGLDALNRAWNTRYADWDDIAPERGSSRSCTAPEIAWRYFMDNVQIAAVLGSRAEAIRAADPLRRPVFAHKSTPQIGAGQDWTHARCQDFLGSSAYPAWASLHGWDDDARRPFKRYPALLAEMHDGVALRFDYLRSASRGKGRAGGAPVWAAEFQGGPVSTGFQRGRVPAPDDIRRWMLTAVGSGVTGISFWVTRAEIMAMEMNGFSLLDSTGDTTPRLEEAARVGAALNRHPDLFGQPTFPPASVAILVNEWNWQHCAAMTAGGEHLSYSVRGWYRLLWDAGVPVDFLEASELDEPRAHAYRALILPFPLSLSETVAGRLAGRVRAGVNLVCEAGPGLVNEHGFCNRGEMSPAMAELFGARPASFQMVREPRSGQRWSPQERTWGEYLAPAFLAGIGPLAGKRLRANGYIQTFTPIGGTPCLRYGKAVAGVTRKVGEGTAWLIGTYVGHAGTAYRNPPSAVCVRTLLARCGVQPAHRGTLLLRKRVLPGKEAWLFTNPTAQALSEIVDVTGWSEAEDLLGEPLERTANRVSLTVNGLDVRVLIVRRP